MSLAVDTSDRLYDDYIRFLFLHTHRDVSVLVNELPEESDQFQFFRTACLAHLKGSVALIMVKTSVIRISIPLELYMLSVYFSFINSFAHYSFSVTFFSPMRGEKSKKVPR